MNSLRPDEIVSESEIEEARKRDENIKRGSRSIGRAALTGGALGLADKLSPFLSGYLPTDLAFKGINKLSPKLGNFLKKGMSQGLNLKDGLDFIKNNLGSKESVKENKNIIQQYSDELHSFIQGHIQKGRDVLQAGALAQLDPKFKSIIFKMESDHKLPFSAILQTSYESPQPAAAQQPQQQPHQPGKGQQALMDILQKLQQQRGSR